MTLKTIKQFADELAVTKKKVEYQASKLDSSLVPKINGVRYLKKEAQTLIKGKLDIDSPPELGGELGADYLPIFREIKNDIISDKNQQIKDLKKQIEHLNKLLDQQQQLQLNTQKNLEEQRLFLDKISDENKKNTKRWWRFWY